MNNLKEKVANLTHIIWIKWMQHLFSQCIQNTNGDYIIPSEFTERWERQIDTDYKLLSDEEKESDREIATEYINLISNFKNE